MDMIIPERLRKRHWDGYDKSMQTGTRSTRTTCCACRRWTRPAARCRSPSPCSCSSAPDGKPNACGSVIRDETDRFAQDRALRKRMAELEAQLAAGKARSLTVILRAGAGCGRRHSFPNFQVTST